MSPSELDAKGELIEGEEEEEDDDEDEDGEP
jgi:hypothetical protein